MISPVGELIVTRFHLAEDNDSGAYCGEFVGKIPNNYLEKPVTLTESLQTRNGIRIHTQIINSEGLEPLVSELKWKVA